VRIVSTRQIGEKTATQIRYFISSLPAHAKMILKAKRSHWQIENQLHWGLDIAFREDHRRVRVGHAAENLSTLRHLALNLLKREKTANGGCMPNGSKRPGTRIISSPFSKVEMRLP
jgi:predicted transposase YbfD/YdcC